MDRDRWVLLGALSALMSLSPGIRAQNSSGPAPANPQASTSSQPSDQNSSGPASDKSGQKKGLKEKLKDQFGSGCSNFGCWGSDSNQNSSGRQPTATSSNRPPRSDASPAESSSKGTKVDLAPPKGMEGHAPGAEPANDVQEMRPWDPHKAEKSIEVGDYYLKQRNYRAAISRYREALYWKDNDAIAQFRLGEALEGIGQYAEARKYYSAYLRTLPQGDLAPDARKSLERLKDKPDDARRSEGPIL